MQERGDKSDEGAVVTDFDRELVREESAGEGGRETGRSRGNGLKEEGLIFNLTS